MLFEWFWSRKLIREGEAAATRKLPEEERRVTLSSDDNMLQRAEKIWALMGFANDRLGMVTKLAAYLGAYRDLDRQYADRAAAANAPKGNASLNKTTGAH